MRLSLSKVLMTAVATAIAGCSDATLPTTPSAPSTLRADRSSNERTKTIRMKDECDPQTFNAMFGAGTCVRDGGLNLDQFLSQVVALHGAPGWRFAPDEVTLRVGDVLAAMNAGGEVHTFTEVKNFGGGFFTPLNDLSGAGETVNECKNLPASAFVAPGATVAETENEVGDEKYQCCIHPWMRATVHISPKGV